MLDRLPFASMKLFSIRKRRTHKHLLASVPKKKEVTVGFNGTFSYLKF